LSGIAGIFHRDGQPVERALLQSLADSLASCAPDARAIWLDGPVGLAHAMLRTTRESAGEQNPVSFESQFWITADARLDCRAELIAEVVRAGRKTSRSVTDSELILHAYAAWGTACVQHLRGDFSFAIWNARTKNLFCARDHFGIRPFYYARLGDFFLFSNALNCIRIHPKVSGELNDTAIGDFLLFGLNYDNATTSFRDVQRLPPGHCLTFSSSGLNIKRYWAPPTDGRIRYAKDGEYIEHFQALLREAVADRLRTERVGILLSGGLDSSSVAAVAKEVSGTTSPPTEIRGYSYVYESLIPDREGEYAREVGDFLRVPVKYLAMDEAQFFERWEDPQLRWPEPIDDPFFAKNLDCYRNLSAECRVLLSGEGCDNLMDFQMWPYVADMRRRGEWHRLLPDVANFLWVRPFPWRGIRARALQLAGKDPDRLRFPEWLAPEFSSRASLAARWKEHMGIPKSWLKHPIHPRGYASLSLPQWTNMFEQENAGATGYPVEIRYPFLDLRIVNYLLALPPFPWFFQKMLLREAMAGRLPERVRVRPKTPLQGDPLSEQLKLTGAERLKSLSWSPDLDRYIDRSALVQPHGKMNAEQAAVNSRPYSLNIWLQSARRVRYNIQAEAGNG
jgi:asparagine synthase (glutamine-hydrolysing)